MTSTLGRHVRPIDWQQRTSGAARYTADLFIAESLTVRVVRSAHAYAAIRSIDTATAAAMPGVHAIITIADFPPGAHYIHEGARDRPPLAEGMVRYVGQEIAAVAAETAEQAAAAAEAIVVSYDRKRGPLTIAAAQSLWSAALHKRTNGKNISKSLHREWGAPVEGSSDGVSVDGRFVFGRQTHASMEPNSIIAQWNADENCLHLWVSTQAPIFVRDEVAQILGLAKEQVICHEVFVGGGFGSKSRISEHEVIAGALALKVKRPVRLVLDRNEEFETTKSRHAFHMNMALHADAGGHVRAMTGQFQVDNGAYDHSGMSVTSAGMKGLGLIYRPQSIKLDAQLIDTATLPGGQFRGYGTTQVTFALESLMDELADRLGRDPIDLRIQNANRDGEETLIGARPHTARLGDCLIAARDAIGWDTLRKERPAGHGVGIASGVHLSGSYAERDDANRSDAAIDIMTSGKVRIRFGGADTGTGQRTMLAQIVAEELGLALEDIDVMTMDTALTPFDLGAWSSRGTHYSGHAARLVAKAAKQKLDSLAQGRVLPIGDLVALSNEAVDGMLTVEASFVETAVRRPDPKTGMGNVSASYNFAAHAAHVNVDTRTGKVALIDYVAVHDVGAPLNLTAVHGQIVGGAAMGIGAALGEDMVFEQGKLVTTGYTYYALPRAADIPNIRSFIVNCQDPLGPYGAKGVGELGINPPPPALANAIADAIGVRIRDLPITPDKILTALARKEGRQRYFKIWRRPDRWWIAFVRWAYPLGLFRLLHAGRMHQPSRSMPPEIEELIAPTTLDEALSSLDQGASPMGGGTDLLLRRSQKLSSATRLVSLAGIPELAGITTAEDGAVVIGSAASLSRLCAPSSSHPVLAAAAQSIASHQIRNVATLAGNLLQANRCWFYRNGFECYQRAGATAPCYAILGDHRFYHAAIDGHRCQAVTPSDMATALTALDADILVRSEGDARVLPIGELYTGPGETVLQGGEVIAAISLPAAARTRVGAFKKLNLWHGDFAISSVAITCRIDAAGAWHDLRIVCGAVAPVPWRAVETEKALAGRKVTAALLRAALDEELNAKAHPLARNGWKLDALAGLCEQAVEEIYAEAGC
jgi:CO/xanthine dehydrogenase Mo-binding subunit/CO/xanthine dehydrogenase FAD-binding subunit